MRFSVISACGYFEVYPVDSVTSDITRFVVSLIACWSTCRRFSDTESLARVLAAGGAKLLVALLQAQSDETVINTCVVLGTYATESAVIL